VVTDSRVHVDVVVIKSFQIDENTGKRLYIMAKDNAGNLWAHDTLNGLYMSANDGSTWTLEYSAASGSQVEQLLQLANNNYLILVKDNAAAYHIWQNTDGTGQNFTKKFDFPSGSWGMLNAQSWVQEPSTGNVYVAEYCPSNQATVSLYQSTDNGGSFAAVLQYTIGQIRHFHNVLVDPYVTGRIWVTIGDTVTGAPGNAPKIGFSDNQGSTWTWIAQGVYPNGRAVGLVFTSTAVYWANDTPDVPAYVWKYDRAATTVTQVAGPFNGNTNSGGPFYSAQTVSGVGSVILGAVETAGNGYVGDGVARWLTSPDGSEWRVAERWPSTSPSGPASPLYMTTVSADGTFWVCYQNLDDTSQLVINLKCQLVQRSWQDKPPVAAHDRLLERQPVITQALTIQTAGALSATNQESAVSFAYDVEILAVTYTCDTTVNADNANYWHLDLRRWRAGSFVNTIAEFSTQANALTANVVNQPTTDNSSAGGGGNAYVPAGDMLVLRYEKSAGSPANLDRPRTIIKYRPLVSLTNA
jgi:hypothetical protein